MLKITIHDSAAELRFHLEGRLSGAWVEELRQCWQTAASTTSGRTTVLDLCDVDFIDPAGQRLVAEMHACGVRLMAATPLIQAIVEDACRACGCGTVAGSDTVERKLARSANAAPSHHAPEHHPARCEAPCRGLSRLLQPVVR